jgi:sugar phosphate isomerase/epimerase
MLLGYNTNGWAHHEVLEAVALLADLGYDGVGITLDHHVLNPFSEQFPRELDRMRRLLQRLGLRSVIETGARFLLDPRARHEPTLVSPDPAGRARRLDFLCRAIDVAQSLGSDGVSFWSGVVHDGAAEGDVWARLLAGLEPLVDYADRRGVTLALEPEPGMFIDSMRRFEQVLCRLDHPRLRLTLDIGHLHCQGETPIADQVLRWAHRLANVHIEDMRAGVHEHLMFGEGEIDFPPVLTALEEAGYQGVVYVELSRHSHQAPEAARRSLVFLRSAAPGRTS